MASLSTAFEWRIWDKTSVQHIKKQIEYEENQLLSVSIPFSRYHHDLCLSLRYFKKQIFLEIDLLNVGVGVNSIIFHLNVTFIEAHQTMKYNNNRFNKLIGSAVILNINTSDLIKYDQFTFKIDLTRFITYDDTNNIIMYPPNYTIPINNKLSLSPYVDQQINIKQRKSICCHQETSYIISCWSRQCMKEDVIPKDVVMIVYDFGNKFKFDVNQNDIKITGNGKIAHQIYKGRGKHYAVNIGHKIDLNLTNRVFKFGIGNTKNSENMSFHGRIGIKFTVKEKEEFEVSHYLDSLPFHLSSLPLFVWSYFDHNFHDIWKRLNKKKKTWFKRGDVIVTELNTKSKTVKWYIQGKECNDDEIFEMKFKKQVIFIQFFTTIGSILYGTFYPESVELVPFKIDFI